CSSPRRPPLCSIPLPYTTLFRSRRHIGEPVMSRKPTFNEYATQCYHQLVASSEDGDRSALLAEAATEAALAVETKHCLAPEATRSEEHTSELQSRFDLVCRLLLE